MRASRRGLQPLLSMTRWEGLETKELCAMPEPLTQEAFDAAMERGGFTDLSPEEREDIRRATAHTVRFAALVRDPAPPAFDVEPATRFAASEATS